MNSVAWSFIMFGLQIMTTTFSFMYLNENYGLLAAIFFTAAFVGGIVLDIVFYGGE